MSNWKDTLKADPTDWLLEIKNPSVRYFTLRDIMDKPDEDESVQTARQEIMQTGLVPEILKKQQEAAYLQAYSKFYTNKYKGLVWSLITLAEYGATITPQIREHCEYLLNNSQEPMDGGFSQSMAVKQGGGRINEVIPCLTGNMVWSLIHFGYLEDPRLQKGIDWITLFMRFNDGIESDPQVSPYNHYDMCWGSHTCHMAVIKVLKALSSIPTENRKVEINDTIQKAVEFLLVHHIYKCSHNLGKKSKPGWLKFGFPLMYQTDVLEILDVLTDLGIKDNRMEDAIKIVISKQDEMGKWNVDNTYANERLIVPADKDEQSKWITLRAMRVLKKYSFE